MAEETEETTAKKKKLTPEEIKKRLASERKDVTGLRGKLKNLKTGVTTKNLVDDGSGNMVAPPPVKDKAAISSMRDKLSSFRKVRTQAAERDVLPKPANLQSREDAAKAYNYTGPKTFGDSAVQNAGLSSGSTGFGKAKGVRKDLKALKSGGITTDAQKAQAASLRIKLGYGGRKKTKKTNTV
jgi:hypothetical protein